MSGQPGYYRFPTVNGQQLVFVSEDDLWTVPLEGGVARRLTAGLGACSHPVLSPDGKWIAFSSAEEGHREVFVLPAEGGPVRRLTFLGGMATVAGWLSDREIVFRTEAFDPNRMGTLAVVSLDGGESRSLQLGPAVNLAIHDVSGQAVVERNSFRADPAHWKRYRGGTAGRFFQSAGLDQEFQPFLADLKSNLSSPVWVGDRLFFLSDHEGIGNVYSCTESGGDLKRHTHFKEYYARNLRSDGKTLVFHAGADIFALKPDEADARKVEIQYFSQRVQRQRKFVPTERYFETFAISRDGRSVCLTARGQVATFGNWWGPVKWAGQKPGVRYRLGQWFDQDRKAVMVGDESGEERLAVHDLGTGTTRTLEKADFGRAVTLIPSSVGEEWIALTNHRNELMLVNLKTQEVTRIARSERRWFMGVNWSPDGRFLAYSRSLQSNCAVIEIYDTQTKKIHPITRPFMVDSLPVFDPEGKYLYFVSSRELNPVYDELQFDLGFTNTSLICLVTLQKDLPSPLMRPIAAPEAKTAGDEKKKESGAPEKPEPVRIDFDGVQDRLVRLPIPAASFYALEALKGKILFASWAVEGALGQNWMSGVPEAKGQLQSFNFETQKVEPFASGISQFTVSKDLSHVALRIGSDLRIVKADAKPAESRPKEEYTAERGWVDLGRMKISVEPMAEWKQMLREVWRLQRDHFWREDMSKIRWDQVYATYEPLLERVNCRSEFGDLVWELQGELGTSHAYEIGGDYRAEPSYFVGFLGAQFKWDAKASGYRIEKIWEGDAWKPEEACPLRAPGVMAAAGDVLTAIQGRALTQSFTPHEALVNLAGQEVEVTFVRHGVSVPETHRVRTLKSEMGARYRTWVEENRRYVHEKSKGRLGYVHVPDMSAHGFAEFHRSYLQEYDYDGLVIDVRFNGGGHVSQLLLEKLSRKRIGFDQTRWMGQEPYPGESPAGPLVAITNEFAGSDGDIFSHSFKLMKLGPLLGTRTWGGVIGIWPRHSLVDGGVTTQPEFSFWFVDVGWNVENYGAVPDIMVDKLPHHYRRGEDPQLDRSIQEAMNLLETRPPFRPKVTEFPDLSFQHS